MVRSSIDSMAVSKRAKMRASDKGALRSQFLQIAAQRLEQCVMTSVKTQQQSLRFLYAVFN